MKTDHRNHPTSDHRRFTGVLFALTLSSFLMPALAPAQTWLGGFEGIYSGWRPADPSIAAGPSSLVTMVSGKMAIFNKQGTKLFEQNLGAGGFWAGQGGDQVPEPWVIYDPHTNRFIAIASEVGNQSGTVYLAISTNSNPTGSASWYKYALPFAGTHQDPAHAGEPTLPDYPKAAVDDKALYITTNHYGINSGVFSHSQITAIDKAPLLSGGQANVVHEQGFTGLFGPLHPVMVVDPAAAMMFVTQDPDDETVSIYALADVLGNPTYSVSTLTVPAFGQPPNVPQAGTDVLLESVGSRFMSGVVRNGSLWTAHAISDPAIGSEAVVRWYEFDVTGLPGADATIVQSGNVESDPGDHTWLPHINVDAEGNMGLVFSVGGDDQYAAIGFTGRRFDDPLDSTLPVQIARNGEGRYTMGLWGQYCGLAIDPNDSATFWLFHMYPGKYKNAQTLNWRTFVGAFQFAEPSPAVEVFSDSFEDGALSPWTQDVQNDWFIANNPVFNGSLSAQVDGSASDAQLISPLIDLQGRPGATITLAWFIGTSLDNGEYLACDISANGGSTWSEAARLSGGNGVKASEGSWQGATIEIASAPSGNVRLRFRGKMNATDEFGAVDAVSIVAQ